MAKVKYEKLASSQNAPAAEEAIVAYWERGDVFAKSITERPDDNPVSMYLPGLDVRLPQ